ncbi:MAG: MBL fold metallo-hydrolase [Lentisphaeria bacterium]|jgi:phosphoribosyl 1,2-cyclic phosphodiesterase
MLSATPASPPATIEPELGLTVLGSGSSGNAAVLHTPEGAVLIDAGFSARELRRRLALAGIAEDQLRAILVTHEHADHICGLRVLAKALKLPVYVSRDTAQALRDRELAPGGTLCLFLPGGAFRIGALTVQPFSIPHDAVEPVAFTFHWNRRKLGFATDLGHANGLAQHHLRECDLLVVESNHDPGLLMASNRPLPLKQRIRGRNGHLSNQDCAGLLRRVLDGRTRHLVLAHASRECNDAKLIAACAGECLRDLGRTDLVPQIASQDTPLPTLWA